MELIEILFWYFGTFEITGAAHRRNFGRHGDTQMAERELNCEVMEDCI